VRKDLRETILCPACGSSEVSQTTFIKTFHIVDCASCSLRYVQDRVLEDEIMHYYKYEYFHPQNDSSNGYEDYFQIRGEREKTFRLYLGKILPYLKRREEVLDIGCGAGYFLNAARPYFRRINGVDVSPEALSRADPSFNLVNSDFHAGLFPAGFADLIMICDLLEHVYHPKDFLREVTKVLHPQGVACIVTPNRKSLLARLTGKRNVSFKLPEHVLYFDPATLGRMLREARLEMISWHACGQYATLDFVIKRLSLLFFRNRNTLGTPAFIRNFTFYVNSGSMLVLARHSRD
jgi:2-polyprenyl-3-methyl-5-hydroxy-6-metoxy-1,4-benzoquinol methylase